MFKGGGGGWGRGVGAVVGVVVSVVETDADTDADTDSDPNPDPHLHAVYDLVYLIAIQHSVAILVQGVEQRLDGLRQGGALREGVCVCVCVCVVMECV